MPFFPFVRAASSGEAPQKCPTFNMSDRDKMTLSLYIFVLGKLQQNPEIAESSCFPWDPSKKKNKAGHFHLAPSVDMEVMSQIPIGFWINRGV